MILSRRRFLSYAPLITMGGCTSSDKASRLVSEGLLSPKVAALEENRLTQDFMILSQHIPWLADIRKSVGLIYCPYYRGSAVLLDNQGTIALCNHETREHISVVFPFQNTESALYYNHLSNPAIAAANLGYSAPIKVKCIYQNPNIDIAFGLIPPETVKAYGLQPIHWAPRTPLGDEVQTLWAGFTGWNGNLDAQYGHSITQIGSVIPLHSTIETLCNDSTNSNVLPGDSGGAVFDATLGQLIGIIKDCPAPAQHPKISQELPFGVFTPVEVAWEIYAGLFPGRARRAQAAMGFTPASPSWESCQLHRETIGTFIATDAPAPKL